MKNGEWRNLWKRPRLTTSRRGQHADTAFGGLGVGDIDELSEFLMQTQVTVEYPAVDGSI